MKKCPRCKMIPLFKTQISGVNVDQCGKCQGNFILPDRLNRIAATTEKTTSELMTEWREIPPIDTESKVRCPQCRMMMVKQPKRGGVKFDHSLCEDCEMIWLDPGDIQLYQLAYLVSDKGKEAQKFKDIHAAMNDIERARLQQLIDELPEERSGVDNPYIDSGSDWLT